VKKLINLPDLKLNTLSIELDGLDLEINTNSSDERRRESIIRETEEKTRLSDT
jgi:hypothetical protein